MIYDIKKGYGLQLTKFDEQYQDTIIYRKLCIKYIESGFDIEVLKKWIK